MKARIAATIPEQVLTFGIAPKERDLLTEVLKELSVQERPVSPEEGGQYVGYLAGLPGFAKEEDAGQRAADGNGVLCMCGFSRKRMDQLLQALQSRDIHIPLKAVLTDTNRGWRFCDLVKELTREHDAFAKKNPS